MIYPYLVRTCDCTDYEPKPGWYVADCRHERTSISGPFETVEDAREHIYSLRDSEVEAAR